MRRFGLLGIEVLGTIILGGFLVLIVLNAIFVLSVGASAFLALLFVALVGIYTFYQHYFGTP